MCMFFYFVSNFMQTNCKVIVFAPNSQIYFSYIAIFFVAFAQQSLFFLRSFEANMSCRNGIYS